MAWFTKRVLTPQEQVTAAIDRLEKSNAMIVRVAHFFAFGLIIATSIASLISLAAAVLAQVISDRGKNIANDASIGITLLLVLAMDTGMVLAATYVRIGRSRGEPFTRLVGHLTIMIVVAALEAATYCYMLWQYEHPANQLAGALIIARGLAVPLLSIYLAMAQEITVNTEDIARLTEIFSGVGLLRHLVEEANDPNASLADQVAIYRAAATLSDTQRAKLDGIHAAVTAKAATARIEPPKKATHADEDTEDQEDLEDDPAQSDEIALRGLLAFGSQSHELDKYVLPNGITRTLNDSKQAIAKLLGCRYQDISQAMKDAEMRPAGAVNGQASNAQNVAVWQVLALVEAGLLDLPANVTRRTLQAVN